MALSVSRRTRGSAIGKCMSFSKHVLNDKNVYVKLEFKVAPYGFVQLQPDL